MSLYDKASLVMIPSGYKASSATLYSVVPNTSVGDFDVTVDADATRVNKDGLIESVAANQARLDYPLTDGVVGDCPHLLLEPSRTNLITDYTGAGFSAFNGASITANDSVSPDGSTNATLMTTTGGGNQVIQQASIGISSGQSYIISGYFRLKSGTLSDPDNAFKGLDGFSGGITGSTFNSSITSEWQRLSFTTTSTTTSGRVQIKCEDAVEILIWGLQVELGSYETSIIPTSGIAETRNAETTNKTGVESLLGQAEGALFLEFVPLDTSALQIMFQIRNSSSSDGQIDLRLQSGNIRALGNDDASPQFNISGGSYTAGTNYKIAVRYKLNDTKFYINGLSVGSDTGCSFGTTALQQISFADNLTNFKPSIKVKQLMVFNTALTDSELQTLTS